MATSDTGSTAALKIAMVAPPWFSIPPDGYGGIEAMTAVLVDGLVERGHDVTLLGAGRHRTKAQRFVSIFDTPPSDQIGQAFPELLYAAKVGSALRDVEVDLVHDHSLAGPLTAAGRDAPTVMGTQNPVHARYGDFVRHLGDTVAPVAVSDAQRQMAPDIRWAGRVHNAVTVAAYPFQPTKRDYVLFLGRLVPEKGAHLAIEAANAAGYPIIIAAKCQEPQERAYFAEQIEPRLRPGVHWFGEADWAAKLDLLEHARALICPFLWEEPFGIVMVEALACGTPVIALRRGAVPEVLVDRVTGLIIDQPSQLPTAIQDVDQLDPADCRADAERRFDGPVMVDAYERIFRKVVATWPR